MEREEYIRVQVESSAWTRKNPGSKDLVRDTILEFQKYVPVTHHVLEIGCGDGYSLDVFVEKGYQYVTGCDINLSKLQSALSFGNIVSLQDVHTLGFRREVFDAVYCTHTLEHTYNGYQAISEIFRVLRPGGILFVIVPDHTRYYGDTFIEANEVVPLEQQPLGFFEDILFERRGFRSRIERNQFPFTMKLLVAVIIEACFELQYAARIGRNAPELWAIATKPQGSEKKTPPLITREWNEQPGDNLTKQGLGKQLLKNVFAPFISAMRDSK